MWSRVSYHTSWQTLQRPSKVQWCHRDFSVVQTYESPWVKHLGTWLDGRKWDHLNARHRCLLFKVCYRRLDVLSMWIPNFHTSIPGHASLSKCTFVWLPPPLAFQIVMMMRLILTLEVPLGMTILLSRVSSPCLPLSLLQSQCSVMVEGGIAVDTTFGGGSNPEAADSYTGKWEARQRYWWLIPLLCTDSLWLCDSAT